MRHYLIASLILVAVCLSLLIPQASALPVSYNQTALNFGLTSVPRNSSSYDVFPLIPDNWLWEKFDNNTIDSGALSIGSTITYNTNLIRLYKFENNLVNSITGSVNGTVTGTTTYTGGHEGQGFSFDGSSYIKIGNISALSFSKTNPFSISTWIKTSAGGDMEIVTKYQDFSSAGYSLRMFTGGNILFRITDNSNTWEISAGSGYNDGNWHHVVATYDGSSNQNGMKIYVDSVLKVTGTSSNTMGTITNSASVTFGALGAGTTIYTGLMDETRLYNTNLSSAQVSALYMVGHYSQSHTFDGGEYVSLGNVGFFEYNKPFTNTFWIKSSETGANKDILTKGNGIRSQGFSIWKGGGNSILLDLFSANNVGLEAGVTTSIYDNTWHYVAITYDGSGSWNGVNIYIDGISQGGVTNNGFPTVSATITNSNNLVFGNDAGNFNPISMQLDNYKIYPYALSSSQITSDYNSISPISSGKQFMSYYNGISGSSTLTKKLGFGSTTTLSCSLNSAAPHPGQIVSNMSNIYYACAVGAGEAIKKFDIVQNTNTHVYTSLDPSPVANSALFMGIKHIFHGAAGSGGASNQLNSEKGNVTQGSTGGTWLTSNQEIQNTATYTIKFNDNSTAVRAVSNTNLCNINYNPSNLTKQLDNIACDQAVPAMAVKYWNGMMIQKIGGYSTNTTQQFLNSVDASAYKKLLTLPCALYGAESPCITFILTDSTQTDYLMVLTSAHVYFGNAQTALSYLVHNNYALQSYDVITQATTSAYEIQNPILQSMTLYGFNLNTTVNKAGLFTLPSGTSIRTTIISPSIRLIDPRWTNDLTDIPVITSSSSLFPIFLTVSNTPAFSAIKVTSGQQLLNNQEAVWAVAQLDSTRSVEVDLPAGTCANVYIADISISPSIWNFQGIICATGVNQKTLAYTNTLPLSFFTLKYGVSDSYVPSNNGLTTSFHTQNSPTTYNVLVKNSTGAVAINQTFTVPANQTLDTRSFNVSSVSKPAVLVVNVAGNQIYSSYLGSPLSLASMASFFHQYFSYQGFDLLSFIPIFFASMFTRNTVGIGMALVVVLIASLSWLSVVTIPDTSVYMAIFIACIGMVGYRSVYG